MSDYVLMPKADYISICDAVRKKSGKTALLRSGEVAGEILGLSDGFYDAFWDSYQQSGQRVNYYLRFTQDGWNDTTFCPKYPITCSGGSTNARSVFSGARMTRIEVPVIITGIPAQETFYRCTKLESISRLVLEGVTDCTGMFVGCTQLKDLNIEGSIQVDLNLSAAEFLTEESLEKVVSCLQDLTGQTTRILTLHAAAAERLSEENKALITAKNWTLAY